jgi:transposase-like protein
MQVARAMSSKSKKGKSAGVRYTPEQKKEIVDFVQQYNEANGRGGQSAAVSKFKVTPISIGAWLKAAGVSKKKGKPAKAAKAAKPPKAKKKAAKKAKGGAKKGSKGAGKRYSADQQQEVIDFVNSYNASNGRGGQSEAARKFNISILTVSTWLKKSGNKVAKVANAKATPAGKSSAKVSSALTAKVASLIQMSDRIQKAEAEIAKLRAGYESLKASIKAAI